MKRTFGQQAEHKACAMSTSSPQERQRGGNTASSKPVPKRRIAGHAIARADFGKEGCKCISV
jgi:hypothetical protein